MDSSAISSAASEDLTILIEDATRRADSEPERAAELATQVLEIAEQTGDRRAKAWGLHLRGWSHFQHGRTAEALADQLTAIELFREVDDELGLGRALAATAPIHDVAGEGAMALSYLEQALEIQLRLGDRWGEARTRNGIAIVLSGDDDHGTEGERIFAEVAEIYEELGDRRWVGFARLNGALTARERLRAGRVPPEAVARVAGHAHRVAAEVLEIARSLGTEGTVLGQHSATVMAATLHELGEHTRALELARQVLAEGGDDLQPLTHTELLIVAANSLAGLGRYTESLEYLADAEREAEDCGRMRMLAWVFDERSSVLAALGRPEDALAAYKRFHELDSRAKSETNLTRAAAVSALLDVQRSEHELALTKVRLDEVENAARDRARLVAAVSHELRSPITSVLGLAATLSDDWEALGPEARDFVELIRREAQDLADMIDDLLTVSRVSSGSMHIAPVEIDLSVLATELVERTAGDTRPIRLEGSATVIADPVRVRQILRNLLSNADRYGGASIRVACGIEDSMGFVEVRDSGPPIPVTDQERIFEPYGQSRAAVRHAQSSGLGLWVARELARMMGGDLVYRHTGGESVFRLTVPGAPTG